MKKKTEVSPIRVKKVPNGVKGWRLEVGEETSNFQSLNFQLLNFLNNVFIEGVMIMKRKKTFFLIFFMLIFHCFPYSQIADHIVVSQVEYDCPGAETAHEYVELYNPSGSDIDISGWEIVYKTATGTSWSSKATLPAGAVIHSCGYFLVGGSLISTEWTGVTVDFVADSMGLSGTGGHIGIRDLSSTVIDYVGWGTAASAEGGSPAPDAGSTTASIERISGPAGINNNGEGNGWDTDVNGNDWVIVTEAPSNSSSPAECPPDSNPPTVFSTNPANGVSGVAAIQDVIIDFSEKMTNTSTAGITISPSPGGESYVWSNNTTTLTILHNNFFDSTPYTVILDKMLVTDLAGNTLAVSAAVTDSGGDTYSFTFTTGNYGDGTGTGTITPGNVLVNNFQTIMITYTASLDMSGGQVSVFVPSNWAQPQTGSVSSAGYVSLSGDATATISSITGNETSGWEIVADITTLDTGTDLVFIYGDQSQSGEGAQCVTTGSYEFTVRSKGTGALSPIATSPVISVYESNLSIVINEIAWMGTTAAFGYEWVELYNPTNEEIDISGWSLEDSSGVLDDFTELNTTTIPAGGYFLAEYEKSDQTASSIADMEGDSEGFGYSLLADAGDIVTLKNASGQIIDQVDCSSGWFAGDKDSDITMERIDPCASSNAASNWANNNGITKNGTDSGGNPINGTPRSENSVFAKSCPDFSPPKVIDIFPATTVNVDTTTLISITFSEQMNTASVSLALDIVPSVAYTLSWDVGNETLTMTLTAPLTEDTLYDITVYSGAMDIAGNSLDGDNDGKPGGNYSFSFNTVDNVSPSSINDLSALSYPTVGGIKITFTAPGDNGATGTCTNYEIAYSTTVITNDTDFNNALKYDTSGITPQNSGNTESIILTLLPAGTTFYISVKGVDESGNKSVFGNTDSAVSGNFGVSKTPNIPLCESGHGNLSLTYSVGSTIFDGDDSMYVIVHSSFTQPDTTNLSILIDGTAISASNYSITGSTITIPNITAINDIEIDFNGYNFPAVSGEYKFGMKINENNNEFIDIATPSFYVETPVSMALDPADDPHSAPGHAQNIVITIKNDKDIALYGAHITGMIIDSPIGATISQSAVDTDSTGTGTFVLNLSQSAGKHIVEFKCNDLTEYFTDTSFEGDFLSTPYPNPARTDIDTITFEINIQEATHIKLTILTMDARKIVDIANEDLDAGYHKIAYDLKDRSGRKIPSGIYFAILKADKFTEMVKFTVVR